MAMKEKVKRNWVRQKVTKVSLKVTQCHFWRQTFFAKFKKFILFLCYLQRPKAFCDVNLLLVTKSDNMSPKVTNMLKRQKMMFLAMKF